MNDKTMDMIFNLKFTCKQMDRLAKKAEKDQKIQEGKVKKAIAAKNPETARIYAENAIRKKNEMLQYMRMSARIDAVASKVQTAYTMKEVTKKMEGVTKALGKAMNSMDLEKVSGVMEKFESQFEELDLRTTTVNETLGAATALSTPEDEVTALIRQVAAENALDIEDQLAELNPATASLSAPEASTTTRAKEDALERRLAALRN